MQVNTIIGRWLLTVLAIIMILSIPADIVLLIFAALLACYESSLFDWMKKYYLAILKDIKDIYNYIKERIK